MSLKIDCGDREFTINIVFGMKYQLAPKTDEEKAEREAMMAKVMEIKPTLEKTVLTQIADHIGYDAATIEEKIHARDAKNAADREAEDQGRAEKKAKRAGLPAPTAPPPRGDPIKPGEKVEFPE